MSYVEANLMEGESVIYRTRLHWVLFVAPVVVIGISAVAFLSGTGDLEKGPGILPVAIGAIGALALLSTIILYFTSEFSVTTSRVMVKVGFLSRRSAEILLTQVEAIGIEQSFLGRLLDYGRVTVTGSGGTREVLEQIQAPMEFRRNVQEQASREAADAGSGR